VKYEARYMISLAYIYYFNSDKHIVMQKIYHEKKLHKLLNVLAEGIAWVQIQ